jgi:hypothetical protein
MLSCLDFQEVEQTYEVFILGFFLTKKMAKKAQREMLRSKPNKFSSSLKAKHFSGAI